MGSLEKAPRWFLLIVGGCGIALCLILTQFIVKSAFADMAKTQEELDRTTEVARTAKNISESNQNAIVELKGSIEKVQVSQETFRKEYREDQKDTQRIMQEVLKAVKA